MEEDRTWAGEGRNTIHGFEGVERIRTVTGVREDLRDGAADADALAQFLIGLFEDIDAVAHDERAFDVIV